MKIVKPINVTDDVLIDSSIPMPDVARGETEWQEESQRIFQSANITVNEGVFIDAIYVDEGSGPDGGSGLFVLSGNLPSGYKVRQYNQAGGVVREIVVPTPQPSGGSHQAVSLSLVNGNILYVARAQYTTGWSFSYVMYSLITFSSLTQVVQISNKFNNYPENSYFRIKTNRFETAVIANNPQGNSGVTVFNSSSQEISSTNQTYSDIAITELEIYALANSPVTIVGGFTTRVSVLGFDLSTRRVIDFERMTGSWSRPVINYGIAQITHGVEHTFQKVYVQAYDKNMVNIGSYKRDDEVIKSSTKRKYRCAVDATFDDPEIGIKLSPPTWVDVGAVNRWMPFDRQPSQQAVSDNPMYYKLKPGEFVRALSIFNISSVSSVNVKVTDPVDGVIYDRDFDLVDNSNVVDMWTYLTLPISFKKELIITDLVCFRESEIEITLSGEDPAVGAIVAGNESPVGRCVTGTGVRSNQFSIRKENGFGGFDIIQRGVGKIARFRVAYDISQIDYITNLLESIDSQYCVFIGELPNNQVISIYGILDPYQSDFETPTINTLEFDVLGVL